MIYNVARQLLFISDSEFWEDAMETLQVPLTAIVSICIGCGVLAVAMVDSGMWTGLAPESGVERPAFTTQSERLVKRYMQNRDYSFEELLGEMRVFFGKKAEDIILKETAHALASAPSRNRDRLHSLRGLAFRSIGREKAAENSFRKALSINPANRAASSKLMKDEEVKPKTDISLAQMGAAFDVETK